MNLKSKENKIQLNRLSYVFQHFTLEQKKSMAKPVDDFLAEPPEKAPRSKNLAKILDFMTQKVFKPIGKFGQPIPRNKQSPQIQKRRRKKMEPSLLLLNAAPENIKRRYQKRLTIKQPVIRRRNRIKVSQENDR